MRSKLIFAIVFVLVFVLLGGCYDSGAQDKNYYVVTDQQTFVQIGEKINQQQTDDIDFNQEMVIAVFQGQQSTGGYEIEIEKVVRTKENLKVYISETVPDPSDIVTQALTSPYHLIKLPKLDLKVEFID